MVATLVLSRVHCIQLSSPYVVPLKLCANYTSSKKKKKKVYNEVEGKLSLAKIKHNASQNCRTANNPFGLCCQTSGGTSSLSFAAKGTLAEKSEGHWLHFPLSPGEGIFTQHCTEVGVIRSNFSASDPKNKVLQVGTFQVKTSEAAHSAKLISQVCLSCHQKR